MRLQLLAVGMLGALTLLYIAEFALGLVLPRALPQWFVPPMSMQRHVTGEFDVTYAYNSWGLRGDDMAADQVYDLVLIGDSFLFGAGVPSNRTIHGRLEEIGLRVFNLSECATKPTHYNYKAKVAFRSGLRSHRVLLGLFIGNDFEGLHGNSIEGFLAHAYPTEPLRYAMRQFISLDRLRYLIEATSTKVLARNRLVVHRYKRRKAFHHDWLLWFADGDEQIARAIREHRPVAISDEAQYFNLSQITPDSLSKAARLINDTGSFLRDWGNSEMLVLLIPDLHYARGELGPRYAAMIAELKTQLNYATIDLHGIFSESDYFPRDGHWNAKGHRKAAAAIVRNLGAVRLSQPQRSHRRRTL